jgi:hypothetical protein
MRIVVLVLTAVLAACGGALFEGGRFAKPGVSYRVGELGSAWLPMEVSDGDLTFRRDGHGTISVNATCESYDDVPAQVLVGHLLFGTTRRVYLVEEEVVLDGRGAQHTVVECELDGIPIRLDMYLITRNGCVFDLGYISGRTAPAQADFDRFVQAFRIERAGRE